MSSIGKLYGKTIINNSDSEDLGENYQVELEYYKMEESTKQRPYGIKIVKRKMENNQMNIEEKTIDNICYREQETDKLLDILINNKVTPISVDDVIHDLTITRVIWNKKLLLNFLLIFKNLLEKLILND